MKEAMFYEPQDGVVRCGLCSHRCSIADGRRGICGVRENQGGRLYSLVYGRAIAAHVDPIEKKPFYHLLPGSLSYSVATAGCNFRCRFCQNADISQGAGSYKEMPGRELSPSDVLEQALDYGCESVAYTYTEPTVFFEYAYDCSVIAREKGIMNLFVTNGFMTAEMLDFYSPFLDAANVDLKSFSDTFYRDVCSARLEPVLASLKRMKKLGIWVEVTTLLIPGKNDSDDELRQIASFIASELGVETPWHVSRFHPDYKMLDVPQTPVESIHRAREIGIESGLRYVYAGNIPGDVGENTYCYGCAELLIKRHGFTIYDNRLVEGRCPACNKRIDGRWKKS